MQHSGILPAGGKMWAAFLRKEKFQVAFMPEVSTLAAREFEAT